jgi:hypothetical protein
MPNMRPIAELTSHSADISDEEKLFLVDLFEKLAEAEAEIAAGAKGEDFAVVAERIRKRIHGRA